MIKEYELRIDPDNRYLTIPRSFGVYELPENSKGRTYRYGNHPIRKIELEREFGELDVLYIYLSRKEAKEHANELNKNN